MPSTWMIRGAAAVAATAVALTGAASSSSDSGRRDQAAFDAIREAQEQAWIEEDGAAFAATFTDDADVVAFNGDHLSTREGIAEGMQYYFDNFIDGSQLHMLSESVRYVESDVVVIVRESCLLAAGETECREDSYSTNTNVLVRDHGEWLQTSFQNTRQFALQNQ